MRDRERKKVLCQCNERYTYENESEQKTGENVRIFYKHIVILIKLSYALFFLSFLLYLYLFFICATILWIASSLWYEDALFLTVGCAEYSFAFSVIHSLNCYRWNDECALCFQWKMQNTKLNWWLDVHNCLLYTL